MSEQANGHAEWSSEDLRALRTALARPGVETLPLFGPERPPVTLDLSGIQALITMGVLVNPVLVERETAVKEAAAKLDGDAHNQAHWREIVQAVERQHDLILGAIVQSPKYYTLDQLPRGAQPEDGLCLWDFTPEMRWAILDVLNGGASELARFRADPGGYATALASERVRAAASGPADADSAAAPEVLAERSAASTRAPRGQRGRGRSVTGDPAPPSAGGAAPGTAETDGAADAQGAA